MPTISFNNSEFYSQPRISDDTSWLNPKYFILAPDPTDEATIVFSYDDRYELFSLDGNPEDNLWSYELTSSATTGLSSKPVDTELRVSASPGFYDSSANRFFDIPHHAETINRPDGSTREYNLYNFREFYAYEDQYYTDYYNNNGLEIAYSAVHGEFNVGGYYEMVYRYDYHFSDLFNLDILDDTDTNGEYIDHVAHYGNTYDWIGAYDGDDQIFTYGGNDTAYGGAGNDLIVSSTGRNNLFGGEGDDTLKDGSGNGFLFGGSGHDYLYGGPNTDILLGGLGNDELLGGSGHDILYDLFGDNLFKGQDGDDMMIAGLGNDRMYGGNGNDTAYAHLGDDYLDGGKGNDVLFGGFGSDEIKGRAGSDILVADHLNRLILNDSALEDYVYYDGMRFAPSEDDPNLYTQIGTYLNTSFTDNSIIDNGLTSNSLAELFIGNDKLRGGDGDDVLFSGNGRDLLYGEGDNDLLIAMAEGQAIMSGGEGADQFAFRGTPMFKAHTIKDFDITEDTLNLSDILDGFDAAVDQIDDFVKLFFRDSGRTDIKVSVEGTGNNWEALTIVEADLEHYTASDLLGQGTLITDDPLFSGSEWL